MFTQLKPALRQIRKYPAFSLINLGGLAIGLASSFILLIYARRELATDRHFRDADRIARIGTDFFHMGPFAFSQAMLRPLLKATCKDVEEATAIDNESEEVRTSPQDRSFKKQSAYYIDSSFFRVFSYRAASGALPSAGLSPGEAIVSEEYAQRYFGREDPLGKTLYVGKELKPYKVIAVLHEGFEKSHLQPKLLLPRPHDPDEASTNWASGSVYNYVKLKPSGSLAGLQTWVDRLREKVVYPSAHVTMPYSEWTNTGSTVSFVVQPLQSIYFDNSVKFDFGENGNLTQVRLLTIVGFLLILLAIINYINLVTARSSIRSKEMGLKKTFGALRPTLIAQIIRESVFFSLAAMLLALALIQVILFLFRKATGSDLIGPIASIAANYILLLLFTIAVGCLAGLYPAFYLTGERNRLAIRSGSAGKDRPGIRNVLVTFQFIIATGLVFVAFAVYSQLQFMKTRDKGFRTEGLIVVEHLDSLKGHAQAFQQMVEQQALVVGTSFCNRTPAGHTLMSGTLENPNTKKNMSIQEFNTDDRYIATLGMRLSDGRNFDKQLMSDTNSLILNESAVAALGLFHPVGTVLNGTERVIGVVKDFNYASFREKIAPAVLRYHPESSTLVIRLHGGNTAWFIDWLKTRLKTFLPDAEPNIQFLDDQFAELAARERLMGNAIAFFTILAITLAILGLIGLTMFTIERKLKEIGIRKVLGAGKLHILGLVAGNFFRLVTIASAIAFPLSWWLVSRWLENFAYRIYISFGAFIVTEGLILCIAMAVIGGLTFHTLAANPVKALRSE
jgi:putative ABC transport system permease protein